MFVVTNRAVYPSKSGLDQIGSTLNKEGANELRVIEAHKTNDKWVIKVLPNEATPEMIDEASIPIASKNEVYASDYVARVLFNRLRDQQKNLLLYVHGYNNDVEDILERATWLEQKYQLEVLCFSWPANGGGARGALSYKSDQADAKASIVAFERCLGIMTNLFNELTADAFQNLKTRVDNLYKENVNAEKRSAQLMQMLERECPLTINMMVHSMGNLLYKKTLQSTFSEAQKLLFDNVILVAADVNNIDHAEWVDKIAVRKSVYITINENDFALSLSRAKLGDEQLARLGHHRKQLNSKEAIYVDFTEAAGVDKSHAYFEGDPVKNESSNSFQFFKSVFNGKHPDQNLVFDTGLNAYKIRN